MFPEGTLAVESKVDRAAMSSMKGIDLNLVALLFETLYQLKDGVIAELRTREGHVIQVLHKKKINMDQLSF